MKKLGSNVALCCEPDSLEIVGTGEMGVKVGKLKQWHNIYSCKNCKKVFYELADFGDIIHLFYSKKGTREYQKELVQEVKIKKEIPDYSGTLVYFLKVHVFVPKRGGVKIGIKTLKGYCSYWLEYPLDTLKDVSHSDMIHWGFDNIRPEDMSYIRMCYESQLRMLKREKKVA